MPLIRTPAALGAAFGGQTGAFGGVAVASDGSNINPVALNLLNAKNPDGTLVIPSPETTGSGVNYTAVLPGHYNEDQFNTNFDVKLRTADHLSAKFFFSNSNQDVPFFGASVPAFPVLRSFGNRILSITETHLLSPPTINHFRFCFSRLAGQTVAGGTITDNDVGMNSSNEPQGEILPHIEVLGDFEVGNSPNDLARNPNNNFYVSNAVLLSRVHHQFPLSTET